MVAGLTGAVAMLLIAVAIGSLLMAGRDRALRTEADKAALDRYAADIHLAEQFLVHNNHMRLLEVLDRQVPKPNEPDYRGWEWFYLRSCCRNVQSLRGSVQLVSWCQDGQHLAMVRSAGAALVGAPPLGGDQTGTIVTRGYTVALLDIATGRVIVNTNLNLDARPSSVAWSPYGSRLASAGGREVKIWDAQTGQEVRAIGGHKGAVEVIAWSPDGRRVATGGGTGTSSADPGEVMITVVDTGQRVLALGDVKARVKFIAWSPDGRRLASSGWNTSRDQTQIWDIATGKPLANLGDNAWGGPIAWSPNGKCVAWAQQCNEGKIRICDADSGEATLTLTAEEKYKNVDAVAWSPDGHLLGTYGEDQAIRFWDVATGRPLRTIRARMARSWSPDCRRLVSPDEGGTLKLRDLETGQELLTLGEGYSFAWSQDGRCLAFVQAGRVCIRDASFGYQLSVRGTSDRSD